MSNRVQIELDESFQRVGGKTFTSVVRDKSQKSGAQLRQQKSLAEKKTQRGQSVHHDVLHENTKLPFEGVWWYPKEPKTFTESLQSFLINSGAEIVSCLTTLMAFAIPNYLTIACALAVHVSFVLIPLFILREPRSRLVYMHYISRLMTLASLVLFCVKSYYLAIDTAPSSDYGIYYEAVGDAAIWHSLLFEITLVLLCCLWTYATHSIKHEVSIAIQLKTKMTTFAFNRSFSQCRYTLQYLFTALSIVEACYSPALIEMPVLGALLVQVIAAVTRQERDRSRSSLMSKERDSSPASGGDDSSLIGWAIVQQRLMAYILLWQRFVISVRLFNSIWVQINPVPLLDFNNTTKMFSVTYAQVALYSAIILTAQLTSKSNELYFFLVIQNELTDNRSFGNQSRKKEKKLDSKMLSATLKVYNVLTFDRRRRSNSRLLRSFYGFLPVLLNWLCRAVVSILAYVLNSKVGFLHLIWVILSFFIPIKWFQTGSVYLYFPLIAAEFTYVYLTSTTQATSKVSELTTEYQQASEIPFAQLLFFYLTVLTVGLMIPARLRHQAYAEKHRGSDMTRDVLVKNIKDEKGALVWKIAFIVANRLHIPVLYLMLFIGNQNFSLFQLGFMFFFVAYATSHKLYVETSFLLPLFISFFILGQYYYRINREQMGAYDATADFLFIADGCCESQWPNLTLWGLMFLMSLLNTICIQFPDSEQNKKYANLCNRHLQERMSLLQNEKHNRAVILIYKWGKFIFDVCFMVVLVSVLLLLAQGLLTQKSSVVNLIYLVLFVITFGQMCQLSIDASSQRICEQCARYIKTFSAVVLSGLVLYHMVRFQVFDLNGWFIEMKAKKSFWILYLTLAGFSEDEAETKFLIQRYTFYLITGQILEYYFLNGRKRQESRDLQNWEEACKTPKSVKRTLQRYQFDTAYVVYRLQSLWPQLDFVAQQWHLVNSALIVYFGLQVSVSLFFAAQLTLLTWFYVSIACRRRKADPQPPVANVQSLAEERRKHRVGETVLAQRGSVWRAQYFVTMLVLFMGYVDDFIVQMHAESDPDGALRRKFDTIQFYTHWAGCYFPDLPTNANFKSLQPAHFVFFALLLEKQAQNWLCNRWGLSQFLFQKFAQLEWLSHDLPALGKEWFPETDSLLEDEPHRHIPIDKANIHLPPQATDWTLDDFNASFVALWKRTKLKSYTRLSLAHGLSELMRAVQARRPPSYDCDAMQELSRDELIDTMSLRELQGLAEDVFDVYGLVVDYQRLFERAKVKIEHLDCVMYSKVKEHVLSRLRRRIKLSVALSEPSKLRQEVTSRMMSLFLGAVESQIPECDRRVDQARQVQYLSRVSSQLREWIETRYSFKLEHGKKLLWEHLALGCTLVNVVAKCNVIAWAYLLIVCGFLSAQDKRKSLKLLMYTTSILFVAEYWVYLFDLTSQTSPSEMALDPYPALTEPNGKYMIPVRYKFAFGRDVNNASWFALGASQYDLHFMWFDFAQMVILALYLVYFSDPTLKTHQVVWSHQKGHGRFYQLLREYHTLVKTLYPYELTFGSTDKIVLRQLKDASWSYKLVTNGKILVFTTMHIFSIVIILLMALARRSLISLGYAVVLVPYLLTSDTAIRQYEMYDKCMTAIESQWQNPEFVQLTSKQQKQILDKIKARYEWSFIKMVSVYLSWYAFLDFATQVVYQIPYVDEIPLLEHFGLHKIYPQSAQFDSSSFVLQVWSCVILVVVSLLGQVLKSQTYQDFVHTPNAGLDLLIQLAEYKKQAITYEFNNQKLLKILAIQKTEMQIFGCVERIKLNVDLFRKAQQRQLLEEYLRTYGGEYLAPEVQSQHAESADQSLSVESIAEVTPHQKLAQVLREAKDERTKLIMEQSKRVVDQMLPFSARLYLWLMKSTGWLFLHRRSEVQRVYNEALRGQQCTAVDLIRLIKSDLVAYLSLWEQVNGAKFIEWPTEMDLTCLRQTNEFCKWQNLRSELCKASVNAFVGNTTGIAYLCMLVATFTNANLSIMLYPIGVFGYALVEETRPGRNFWRTMLAYTLVIVLLKYIVNLQVVDQLISSTQFPFIDGFVKIGLHITEGTETGLVWQLLPEICLVTAILCHEILQQMQGLYTQSETEIENVSEAIDRIYEVNQVRNSRMFSESEVTSSAESDPFYLPQMDLAAERDSHQSHGTLQQLDHDDDSYVRASTTSAPPTESSTSKKTSFWTSDYMSRVYPRIQQQKPGSDYYGYLTFVQALLCCYLVLFFDSFAASSPFMEQNIFRQEMVIVLLYQILMIVIERYVARTENRQQVERKKRTSHAFNGLDTGELFLPQKHGETTVRLVIEKLKFQFLADKANLDSLQRLRLQHDIDIALTDSEVTPQQKWKFVLHWLNLIAVHAYIFWYLPLHSNLILYGTPVCSYDQIYGCKDFEDNRSLQIFYLLNLVYFYFSAQQISKGLPSFRRGSSTMLLEGTDSFEEIEDVGNVLHTVFVSIPLAVELRCLLDFTFSKTALDIWQTCQLFQYTSDFFIAKNNNMYYNRKGLGEEPQRVTKLLCGYCLTSVMLTFIIAPFVMFSSLGGTTIYNPVTQAQFELWAQVNYTNADQEHSLPLKLYGNDFPEIYDFTESMFEQRSFDEWPETKFFDPEQVQYVVASEFSERQWDASHALRQALIKYACQVVELDTERTELWHICEEQQVSVAKNVTFGFQLRQSFLRDGPADAERATITQHRPLNLSSEADLTTFMELTNALLITHQTKCTLDPQPITIQDFYTPTLLLGETATATAITTPQMTPGKLPITIQYTCDGDQWSLHDPLIFTVFSQRITVGFLQGYNILTFYAGIVFVFGMYLRPVFVWTTDRAFIYECNYPDPLLRLCESIYLSRARGDLRMEEENWRLLQDIVRSPELLHALTGSSMKSAAIAPSEQEQRAHLIPKAFN